jgi:hypothetical protein
MVALNVTRRSRPSRAAYARLPRENPPPPRSCSAPRSPSVQRARYYDPSTAEFTSRDPLEYVDGVSLYRGYLQLTTADPIGLANYNVRVVAKSFINGLPRIGRIDPDREGVVHDTWFYIYRHLLGNFEDPEGDFEGLQGAISGLKTATDRLHFLARLVKGLKAFNEDPKSDAMEGVDYRLFTRLILRFTCCSGTITDTGISWAKDGGNEGPYIDGTIELDVLRKEYVGDSAMLIEWIGYGRPNLLAEPGMQWVASRTSVHIWHRPKIQFSCVGDEGYIQVLGFKGSLFPSRRLWVNGVLKEDIDQGAFSDLWDPDPNYPEFVR